MRLVTACAFAGAVGLTLALPALWLTWEGDYAQAEADLLAAASKAQAEATLRNIFSGFDRATGSLRPETLTGDNVALTARLLLLAPIAEPTSGLTVVDAKGAQIAASSPGNAPVSGTAWWATGMAGLPTRHAALLGCAGASKDDPAFMLVRRIDDNNGESVGAVAGAVPASVLRAAAAPDGLHARAVDYALRDDAGCKLAAGTAALAAAGGRDESALVRLYRAVLPDGWGNPRGAVVSARIGNVAWTGTVRPEAALALRATDIEQHAGIIETMILGLLGLQALLAGLPGVWRASGARPTSDGAEIVEPSPSPVPRRTALVVGLAENERRRVARQLEAAGFAVDLAADGVTEAVTLGRPEQADRLHRTLDLMILDAKLSRVSAEVLLSRLKRRADFMRLRIVLVAQGRIVGAFGGAEEEAPLMDKVIAEVFGGIVPPAAAPDFAPARLRQALAAASG
jgi:CheY-like chemotaxis protein